MRWSYATLPLSFSLETRNTKSESIRHTLLHTHTRTHTQESLHTPLGNYSEKLDIKTGWRQLEAAFVVAPMLLFLRLLLLLLLYLTHTPQWLLNLRCLWQREDCFMHCSPLSHCAPLCLLHGVRLARYGFALVTFPAPPTVPPIPSSVGNAYKRQTKAALKMAMAAPAACAAAAFAFAAICRLHPQVE